MPPLESPSCEVLAMDSKKKPVKKQKEEGDGVSRRDFIRGVGGAIAGMAIVASPGEAKSRSKRKAQPVLGIKGPVGFNLKINGQTHRLLVEPRVTLLDALREKLKLTGAKRICDRGSCGGCTVLMDGLPVYACMMLAIDAQGKEISTVEGLAPENRMTPLQSAFVEKDALMCGFCTPGFVMSLTALLRSNPNPTEEEIKNAIRGNVCRCGTYPRIIEAALASARRR
ncbi:MAG: (2Fe-2S)-binding protein [Armatimonadetes bacterium]|nr:(2Fe-2S)-binding protein [Armatimonadota bacterium]